MHVRMQGPRNCNSTASQLLVVQSVSCFSLLCVLTQTGGHWHHKEKWPGPNKPMPMERRDGVCCNKL